MLYTQTLRMRPSLTQITRGLNTSAVKIHFYNSEQEALQQTTHRLVEETINQDWELWEKEKIFPGKKVFKKFGAAGLLGIHRPTQYGGQGLSYKYNVAFLEALGHSKRSQSSQLSRSSQNTHLVLAWRWRSESRRTAPPPPWSTSAVRS